MHFKWVLSGPSRLGRIFLPKDERDLFKDEPIITNLMEYEPPVLGL